MATRSDSQIINRESQNIGLADRYKSKQRAGGTFSAYDATTNTMIKGVTDPHGYTQKSRELTIEAGFTPKLTGENFNQKALDYSDQTKLGPVLKDGVNTLSTNWNGNSSIKDKLFTVDAGFKLKAPLRITQLKDAANGVQSKELSQYIRGFNNKKYKDGKFTR